MQERRALKRGFRRGQQRVLLGCVIGVLIGFERFSNTVQRASTMPAQDVRRRSTR